jgi:hypothetical protein
MSSEDCRYCPDHGLCSWCLSEGMVEIEQIVPKQLVDEYLDDPYVNTCFQAIRHRGGTREEALILCVKELVKHKNHLTKELTDQMWLKQPVIIYKDSE